MGIGPTRSLWTPDNPAPANFRAEARRRLNQLRQSKQHEAQALDRAFQDTEDTYYWATRLTKTFNEHWEEEGRPSPYEPFPDKPYSPALFYLLDLERIHWFEKSRDMMLTWHCVAFLTKQAMRVPRRGVLFQTQKEKKAIQLVDYAKCLYRTQPDHIKEAFPLVKDIDRQGELILEFKHGGYVAGIPGGADQIRSYHPWGYLNDESSFQPDAGECYNEALSAVKGKIIFNSSAGPGWYADARRDIVRNEEE